VLGCSTGGEIHGCDVLDESLSLTALSFAHTELKCAAADVATAGRLLQGRSRRSGRALRQSNLKPYSCFRRTRA
jgi:hypothetical protein